MDNNQVSIYGASKLHHAPMWIALRETEPFITWTARWPELVGNTPDTPGNASAFWRVDYQSVVNADFTFVYAEKGEHLRGALVEAGIALGAKRKVIVIGEHPDFGTWQYHPGVLRATDMDNALWMAKFMYGGY